MPFSFMPISSVIKPAHKTGPRCYVNKTITGVTILKTPAQETVMQYCVIGHRQHSVFAVKLR